MLWLHTLTAASICAQLLGSTVSLLVLPRSALTCVLVVTPRLALFRPTCALGPACRIRI